MHKTNSITVDTDEALQFEVPTQSQKIRNFFLVPVLNNLPAFLLPVAAKTHRASQEVIAHKTEHSALEILYQSGASFPSRTVLEKFSFWIWFGLDNPRAVRNRLKIVKREIQKELRSLFETNAEVKLLSIAAGSARAVLESIANVIEKYPDRHISVTFLDKNPKAADYSRGLAEELKLSKNPNIEITWVTDTIGSFMKRTTEVEKFHIVEMVGLLDYFDPEKSLQVFKSIKAKLFKDGLFVCANINDNAERKFLTNFIGWRMDYKTAEELVEILVKSGFSENSVTASYEPLKIHSVTCAYNTVS